MDSLNEPMRERFRQFNAPTHQAMEEMREILIATKERGAKKRISIKQGKEKGMGTLKPAK